MLVLQIINVVTLVTVITQNKHVFDLYQNQYLNSSSLRKLYRLYFILCIISFGSIALLNLLSIRDLEHLIKAITSSPIIIISIIYSMKAQYTIIDPFDQLERQLLITPQTQTETSQLSNSIPFKPQLSTSEDLKSTDISPLISPSQKQRHILPNVSSSLGNSKMNAPILATLLSADVVRAQSSTTTTTTTTTITQEYEQYNGLITILSILIAVTFIASQWCYSIAILKSNVYKPLRYHLFTTLSSMIVSLALFGLIPWELNSVSLIQLHGESMLKMMCNYFILGMLFIQTGYLCVKLIGDEYKNGNNMQVVEIYNSIEVI